MWVAAPASFVHAENVPMTKQVEVMGIGFIYKGDIAAARGNAIANSLSAAVDRVVMKLMPLESLIKEFKTVNDMLHRHRDEFIQDYKVLTEYTSGKIYKVMVQATVLAGKMEKELSGAGIEIGKKTMPKILFLISEQNLEEISPRYWWGEDISFSKSVAEIALNDVMTEKGFTAASHEGGFTNIGDEDIVDKPLLSDAEALDLGAQFEADVVVVGRSKAQRIPNVMGGNIKSFEGSVAVRALRTDTGEEIASRTENYVTTNADESKGARDAIAGAGTLAGISLASQIVSGWKKAVQALAAVEIFVKGTGNLGNFIAFRRALRDITGVKGIQLKEMQPNEAVIMVNFQGDGKKLADALMLKTFESFGISITEVLEKRLRIELTQG